MIRMFVVMLNQHAFLIQCMFSFVERDVRHGVWFLVQRWWILFFGNANRRQHQILPFRLVKPNLGRYFKNHLPHFSAFWDSRSWPLR